MFLLSLDPVCVYTTYILCYGILMSSHGGEAGGRKGNTRRWNRHVLAQNDFRLYRFEPIEITDSSFFFPPNTKIMYRITYSFVHNF